jgi:hypothetical protein
MGLLTTALLLLVITVPLTVVFVESVHTSRMRQVIQETLRQQLKAVPGAELVHFDFHDDAREVAVDATLHATRELTGAEAKLIGEALGQALGGPAHLRLVTIPVTEVEVPP